MRLTRGYQPSALPPVALAIGNFDGVHLGHQAILARVRSHAAASGFQSALLTFEPHPRERLSPALAPTRITTLREKLGLLRDAGVDRVHVLRFTRELAALSPRDFATRVIAGALGARWVLVGGDFRFGAGRTGDVAQLRALGAELGFGVEIMEPVEHGGLRVSSSAVREALQEGRLDRARALRDTDFRILGRVVHGDKLGRKLGFATANVQMRHNRPPLAGIFVVRMRIDGDAGERDGVASLGVRPTVKANGQAVLEVHLFDFNGDLYGRQVAVRFLHKIRDEARYDGLEALTAQIARDCDAARDFLARQKT